MGKQIQLLALHGFTGCGEDFREFSSLCALQNTVWRLPDLPGHGPCPSLSCKPDEIIQFVNNHSGAKPRVLLGYSMGARAALLHAVTHPDYWDAMILISVNPGIETEPDRIHRVKNDRALARQIKNEGIATFLDYWQNTPIIQSQQQIRLDWRQRMQRHRLEHTAEGLTTSMEQFGLSVFPNLWPQLAKLTCPVLLITGESDDKYCTLAKRISAILPCTRWECIPDAGHMPHLEAPNQTALVIQHFIGTIYERGI